MALKKIKKRILFILFITACISALGWKKVSFNSKGSDIIFQNTDTSSMIHPDHIIFLWLENRGFKTIIGNNTKAPYINSLLAKGTVFANMYAITHPSYPNYLDFFAGDENGITSDVCINDFTFSTPNLYTILKVKGKSFAWYSEDLPETGSRICYYDDYVQKHNPTTCFDNVPGIANKRFADFPTDYTKLENVVCISPNQMNDMHTGSIKQGDDWFGKHLASLVDWCITHNSVFVVYFDESEYTQNNRIPVIAIGQHVKKGYRVNDLYDHFCWTRTISAMFQANEKWTDNLQASKVITGCWE